MGARSLQNIHSRGFGDNGESKGHTSFAVLLMWWMLLGRRKDSLSPQYILSASADTVVVRNYEGVIAAYKEPGTIPAIE